MKIKLHVPTFGEEEIAAAVDVLRSTWVTSGEKVREFEAKFGPNAVMCNSGSSANLLAIAALCNPVTENRMVPGDEVIVSALSWSTTVWPLVQHGLVPVIVDIDPETLNIDPDQVEKAIGPKAGAIMPVHVYGNPYDINALSACVSGEPLWHIADCCEALGASHDGKPVDRYGAFATYSFYFSHHMTTLEGGIVIASSERNAELLRILRAHGWTRDMHDPSAEHEKHPEIDPRFLFVNAGYNLRATELQAAIGLVQLPKLEGYVETRRSAAARLGAVFQPLGDRFQVQKELPRARSSRFGFPITVAKDAPFTAAELRWHFAENGIETRPIICGNIARQPGMKLWPHRVVGDLKHADHVMANSFSLPCHQAMGEEETAYIGGVLKDFLS